MLDAPLHVQRGAPSPGYKAATAKISTVIWKLPRCIATYDEGRPPPPTPYSEKQGSIGPGSWVGGISISASTAASLVRGGVCPCTDQPLCAGSGF